ncbi:MAG: HYExAFE family protein [Sedimentisphaerales bacterium]|nr:HYExAFE family protein [Sedimentisphaerales bacterium]
MKDFLPNHYERAFENWLIDNRIEYESVDEHKRTAFGHSDIKSFDFLLYPPGRPIVIAEVKGRKFKGTSLVKLAGFECWATIGDVEGLTRWQQIFGEGHQAAFVFAYKMENIDVDFDGRDYFDFDLNKYLFFCVKLDDYRKFMKRRSSKWQTVTLPAEKFRDCAVHIRDFLL